MKDGYFMYTSCGSPNYAAPEVISAKYLYQIINRPYCGNEADIWSCGVILYALLSGNLPFDDEDIAALYKKIHKAQYHIPKYFSMQVRDLLSKMLNSDPAKRITAKEIKQHPWFLQNLPIYLMLYDDFEMIAPDKKIIIENATSKLQVDKSTKDMEICSRLIYDELSKTEINKAVISNLPK